VFVRGVRLVHVHHRGPLEVGHCGGYCVQTLEPSHVAGQWRKLSPSANLMVDPGREVGDTGYRSARSRPLPVTAFDETDPVAAGRGRGAWGYWCGGVQ
jgi:hypothetical protein